MEDLTELDGMKRAELQRLAKKAGIKANMKTDAIIEELKKYYTEQGSLPLDGVSSCDDKSGAESSATSASESASSSANEEPEETKPSEEAPTKKVVRKGRKGRKRAKDNVKPTVVETPEQKVATPAVTSPRPLRRATRSVTPKTETTSLPEATSEPTLQKQLRRTTRSVTPKTNNALPVKTSPTPADPQPLRRATRSVTPKGGSTFSETVLTPTVAAVTHRRTFEVEQQKEEEMTVIESDPEMKRAIMAELEKAAEEQFALQSKIPKPRSKVIKPVTPGNKDWSRIHQTNFNKMESIDDYLARKRKRTDTLSASVKRAKLIADEAKAAVETLTTHRTPQSTAKKTAKPVSRAHPGNLTFMSPKTSLTKRRAASTKTTTKNPSILKGTASKTVTFKTSRLKTPTRAAVLLGGGIEPKLKRKSTPGPRKSVSVLDTSAKKITEFSSRKSLGDSRRSIGELRKSIGGAITPFKSSQTPNKPSFDLKASLNKPLGYKPHTGKLKPLQVSTLYKTATSNIQKAKDTLKKPVLKTREDRRAGAKQNRANKRANVLMSRRGINA
ncbi:nucleolar and spindle-associated protein 1-like [Asterias rubens]|uniref:nucleolar and spindle-associated protein 1-like n=1 Tax=Asterias rubens TaxID=7604 RepID=UPI001455AFAE|nr:nucleolar and spindle-associated protein 1-like [Asterias rubens]